MGSLAPNNSRAPKALNSRKEGVRAPIWPTIISTRKDLSLSFINYIIPSLMVPNITGVTSKIPQVTLAEMNSRSLSSVGSVPEPKPEPESEPEAEPPRVVITIFKLKHKCINNQYKTRGIPHYIGLLRVSRSTLFLGIDLMLPVVRDPILPFMPTCTYLKSSHDSSKSPNYNHIQTLCKQHTYPRFS